MSSSGFDKLSSLHRLKIKEIFCPVSGITVHVSPLTVGDDLSLRTMVASPEYYDREISALLFKHITFPDTENGVVPTFDQFIANFSSFDRRLIIYGVFASTYKTIAEDTIKCNNCGHEFKDKINTADIIDVDSFELWDKEIFFTEYFKEITVPVEPDTQEGIKSISFVTAVPSIKDQFDILGLVPPDQMKHTYEKTGQILTRAEELSLITKQIKISSVSNGVEEEDSITGVIEITRAISDYITSDIVNDVVDQYNDEFEKYNPKFGKKYNCEKCGFKIEYPVNIEANLFRNFFNIR